MRSAAGRAVALAIAGALALACAGCGDNSYRGASPAAVKKATDAGTGGLTAAQLAEARRLLDPTNVGAPPTPPQIACVARVVVLDPNVDQIANDLAQIENKDLRQLVMTDYLHCAYSFVLDLYMRFAPAGLSGAEKACIRSKFTELDINRLSEVIVEDPDAGYTGPLVIHACESGSKTNPLLHGTLPGMGGGS